jgi:RNA polymerase sigma-70 factor (ECF subfamily)
MANRQRARLMRPSRSDEDALARAFSAKERWAFEEAYARYGSLLYSIALRVLGDSEDAKDSLHDALARVWRSPGAYTTARGGVRSFLAVCVRNEAITRLRSKTRGERTAQRLAAERQEHEELGAADVIENERLHRALAMLPREQRRPLELAYFEQKTHREIAAELGEPLGTIKSRIALGLRKLGMQLGAEQ